MREAGPRRRALARGLRSRSFLIILAAALLALAALAGLQWFVASGTFTVIPERLMLRIPNDDYVHVSYRIAELKRTPPTTPVVYLFGGSGTLEMIRSEGALAAAISADAGTSVRVVTLAAHAQSMGQTLAIIDNLPRGRGLLAIGLSPNRFTAAPSADASQLSGSPLALTSPRLAALLAGRASLHKRLPGLLTGTFDFVLAYLNQRVISKSPDLLPITYAGHYFTDGPVASFRRRTSGQAIELARERPQYAANIAYNLAALTAAVRAWAREGLQRRLLRAAPRPRGERTGLERLPRRLSRRCRARGARPRRALHRRAAPRGAANEDFADLFHLVNSGRDKWTPLIARALAVVLRQGG